MVKKLLSLVFLFTLVISFLFILPIKESTVTNPLNVKHVSANEKVEVNKDKESSSEESESSSKSVAITWTILITAVIVVGGINIARLKKKGISIDDEM